jgi:hypothetical protein
MALMLNYVPRGETVTAAYLHKALAKIFGLKRPSMSVQSLVFARPTPKEQSPPLFSITVCGKRHHNVLSAPLFAIFYTSGLFSLPESEIRAGKLLVNPGHL